MDAILRHYSRTGPPQEERIKDRASLAVMDSTCSSLAPRKKKWLKSLEFCSTRVVTCGQCFWVREPEFTLTVPVRVHFRGSSYAVDGRVTMISCAYYFPSTPRVGGHANALPLALSAATEEVRTGHDLVDLGRLRVEAFRRISRATTPLLPKLSWRSSHLPVPVEKSSISY